MDQQQEGLWGLYLSRSIPHFVTGCFPYHDSCYEEFFLYSSCLAIPTDHTGTIISSCKPWSTTDVVTNQMFWPSILTFVNPHRDLKMLKYPGNKPFLLRPSDSDQPVSEILPNKILEQYADIVVDELRKLEGGAISFIPRIQHLITLKSNLELVAKWAYTFSLSKIRMTPSIYVWTTNHSTIAL